MLKIKTFNSEKDLLKPKRSWKTKILFDQAELTTFIGDLYLWKDKYELPGSRWKEKNLLEKSVRISYCHWRKNLAPFCFDEDNLIFVTT